jgi:hypothetical protein
MMGLILREEPFPGAGFHRNKTKGIFMQCTFPSVTKSFVPLVPLSILSSKAVPAAHAIEADSVGPALWVLNRTPMVSARRFGITFTSFMSHPDGKGAGDYREPVKTPDTGNKPLDPGRSNDRSGTSTPTRDSGTRSGGSSEKMGFASEKQPDAPKKGDKGDVDRPALPVPATRDPDGSLNRRGGTTDPGVSWGGGGSDLGGGGSNSGLF